MEQNKQPTHKEIMNNWWEIGTDWHKVIAYDPKEKRYLIGSLGLHAESCYFFFLWYSEFRDCKSCEFPLEGK